MLPWTAAQFRLGYQHWLVTTVPNHPRTAPSACNCPIHTQYINDARECSCDVACGLDDRWHLSSAGNFRTSGNWQRNSSLQGRKGKLDVSPRDREPRSIS